MKTITTLLLACCLITTELTAQIAINNTAANPDASAILDLKTGNTGVNKGFLPQAVALTATNSALPVTSPATGLIVYNTATAGTFPYNVIPAYYYWNGIQWIIFVNSNLASGNSWNLIGNSGTNSATNFIGTTDNNDVVFKRNNVQSGLLNSSLDNTSWGVNALNPATTGIQNTAIGSEALHSNTSGNQNSAVGMQALNFNNTGKWNTANGWAALYSNTMGSNNTAIGQGTLYSNTIGNSNTAIGQLALYSNISGSGNTALGYYAGYNNIAGYNVFLGDSAGSNNTIGDNDVATGFDALFNNTTGYQNTAIGSFSLYYNNGAYNTATGMQALYANTIGGFNTAFGADALVNTTGGAYNTGIGHSAGAANTSGIQNTFVGERADANSGTYNNATAIGYGTIVTASNSIVLGNTSVTAIGGYAPYVQLSDSRFKNNVLENVHGLDFIMKLKPVTYNLNVIKLNTFLGITDNDDASINKKSSIIYSGFLAQDVEQSAKEVNYDFSGVILPQNDKDHYKMSYADFVVPLVKAVQEQQQMIEEQKKQIAELIERVEQLEKNK